MNEKAQKRLSNRIHSITKVTEVLDKRVECWASAMDMYKAVIHHVKYAVSHSWLCYKRVMKLSWGQSNLSSTSLSIALGKLSSVRESARFYEDKWRVCAISTNVWALLYYPPKDYVNATAAAIGDKDNEKHKKDMTIATQVSPIKNETKKTWLEEG